MSSPKVSRVERSSRLEFTDLTGELAESGDCGALTKNDPGHASLRLGTVTDFRHGRGRMTHSRNRTEGLARHRPSAGPALHEYMPFAPARPDTH